MTESGIQELSAAIDKHAAFNQGNFRLNDLFAEKAYTLIQKHKMQGIQVLSLRKEIENLRNQQAFNLYAFVESKINEN